MTRSSRRRRRLRLLGASLVAKPVETDAHLLVVRFQLRQETPLVRATQARRGTLGDGQTVGPGPWQLTPDEAHSDAIVTREGLATAWDLPSG